MKENRQICFYTNDIKISKDTEIIIKKKFEVAGFEITSRPNANTELIVCIGGDGGFLRASRELDFPDIQFVGINTGHLGFFQEITVDEVDKFISDYLDERYAVQNINLLEATVIQTDGTKSLIRGINEIVIKGSSTYPVHLDIFIGGSLIEKFSGDGILVATSAGSTAYNYSLGGAIVDPRLELIQVTPIAPMNSVAYRSFTSSILLPTKIDVSVKPERDRDDKIKIDTDGQEYVFQNVEDICISYSDQIVKLLRFSDYDFWKKVKSKFL